MKWSMVFSYLKKSWKSFLLKGGLDAPLTVAFDLSQISGMPKMYREYIEVQGKKKVCATHHNSSVLEVANYHLQEQGVLEKCYVVKKWASAMIEWIPLLMGCLPKKLSPAKLCSMFVSLPWLRWLMRCSVSEIKYELDREGERSNPIWVSWNDA